MLWNKPPSNVYENYFAYCLTVPEQPVPGGPLPLTRSTLYQHCLDGLWVLDGIWSLLGAQGSLMPPGRNSTSHRDQWWSLSSAVQHSQAVCIFVRRGVWTQFNPVQPTLHPSRKILSKISWVSWMKKEATTLAPHGKGRWILVWPPEIVNKYFS